MFDLVCTRAPPIPDPIPDPSEDPDDPVCEDDQKDCEDDKGKDINPEPEKRPVNEDVKITEGEEDSEISELYWMIPVISAVLFLFFILYICCKIWQRRKYKKEIAKQKEEKEKKASSRKSRIVSKKKKDIDLVALSTERGRDLEEGPES